MSEREEFVRFLHKMDLEVDPQGGCAICLDGQRDIYLTLNHNHHLVASTILGTTAPSKYRELLFLSALKKNEEYPRVGIFSYDAQTSEWIFFQEIPFGKISSESCHSFLFHFGECAGNYTLSLNRGELFS